jgi:hypothetical protein
VLVRFLNQNLLIRAPVLHARMDQSSQHNQRKPNRDPHHNGQ